MTPSNNKSLLEQLKQAGGCCGATGVCMLVLHCLYQYAWARGPDQKAQREVMASCLGEEVKQLTLFR